MISFFAEARLAHFSHPELPQESEGKLQTPDQINQQVDRNTVGIQECQSLIQRLPKEKQAEWTKRLETITQTADANEEELRQKLVAELQQELQK